MVTQPDAQHPSASHGHRDNSAPSSDVDDGSEDVEDLHSSEESDAAVSSSGDESEVLEMYCGSDVGSDLMDIDEYL